MKKPSQWPRILGVALCFFATFLWAICALGFFTRADALAAVTVIPAWFWCFVGAIPAILGWLSLRKRAAAFALALWVIFAAIWVEELRFFHRAPPVLARQPNTIRVISLNCSAGDPNAAREVKAWRPDIVLLQESPSRADTQKMARELFGPNAKIAWGVDGSILARGEVSPVALPPEIAVHAALADVDLGENQRLRVASLRLMPAVFRFDLWNAACWHDQTENRRARREQLESIAQFFPQTGPLLVGGDWNAPQGDAIFRVLPARLSDVYAGAGTRWGNTITNEMPVLRIDQIWACPDFSPQIVGAAPSQNSDHHLVIADLKWDASDQEKQEK